MCQVFIFNNVILKSTSVLPGKKGELLCVCKGLLMCVCEREGTQTQDRGRERAKEFS